MKLLQISVPKGYRMLEKGFSVNLLTKTRVSGGPNPELIELEPGLPYPIETIFLGKNSSGKSTVMDLFGLTLSFLFLGRLPIRVDEIPEEAFSLSVLFYEKGFVYQYRGTFSFRGNPERQYPLILEESLEKTTWKKHYKKDLSNLGFARVSSFLPNIGGDTSNLAKMFADEPRLFYADFKEAPRLLPSLMGQIEDLYGLEALDALLHLFDDSIASIRPAYEQGKMIGYAFQRAGSCPVVMDYSALARILSQGTLRGILLFGMSMVAFRLGGQVLVDEIERHFNRNLVEDLMGLYAHPEVNRAHATIIYTTHYAELLDHGERCDNVNVLHREGNLITLKNLNDYGIRTDLLKSNQFNQNAFDTLANFERSEALREAIAR